MNPLFKKLTNGEKRVFQQWARDNYKPFSSVPPVWHPTVQKECALINSEIKETIEAHWGKNFIAQAIKTVNQ